MESSLTIHTKKKQRKNANSTTEGLRANLLVQSGNGNGDMAVSNPLSFYPDLLYFVALSLSLSPGLAFVPPFLHLERSLLFLLMLVSVWMVDLDSRIFLLRLVRLILSLTLSLSFHDWRSGTEVKIRKRYKFMIWL